jgi:hypothetical protein
MSISWSDDELELAPAEEEEVVVEEDEEDEVEEVEPSIIQDRDLYDEVTTKSSTRRPILANYNENDATPIYTSLRGVNEDGNLIVPVVFSVMVRDVHVRAASETNTDPTHL